MKSRLQFKSACFLNKYDILINPEMKWLLCVLQGVSHKFIIAVLMEYIRSLNQFQITVQVKLNRVTPCVSHWNIFSSSCVFLIDWLFFFSITCMSWWSRRWCSTTSSTCCTSSSSITSSATPNHWWVHTQTELKLILNQFRTHI